MTTIEQSNSLADLAHRINVEHKATVDALRSAVVHAMAAGDLLLEAKKQIPHGQREKWFEDHCEMSDRSRRLYMQLAKHRKTIEKEMSQNGNGVADLTLNEAAALCVLAGRLEKMMEFAKRAEGINGEDLVNLCIKTGFGYIPPDPDYDQFAGRSEEEKRDWILFGLFIGDLGMTHVEWLLQRGSDTEHGEPSAFQNPDRWLGEAGAKWRATNFESWKIKPKTVKAWEAYRAEHSHKTVAEVEAVLLAARSERATKVERQHELLAQ
jgi:hypothetical protein